MFTMVYAIPCGGQRSFSFSSAEALAEHVQANRPKMFAGMPQLSDEKHDEKLADMARRGWYIPQEKK